ncbi:hypothetical protein, partial [Dyadobacter sp. 50-39]|uniref:hypothetical protein n=1 Tax=Dyadobacter sp. 50-39 TaxID=1895756 RepID=UPI0025B82E50
MRRFIAYFDFLGYKHFILNNPSDYLRTRASHILRDIELSLAGDNDLLVRDGVYIPDIGQMDIPLQSTPRFLRKYATYSW